MFEFWPLQVFKYTPITCPSHAAHIGAHLPAEEDPLFQSLGSCGRHPYCNQVKLKFSKLAFRNQMKQRYPLWQFSLQMVFCPFSWLFCLPEGTNVSFIVHLLNLHQVSNSEQVVVWGRYVKHSVRKSCPERNSYELIFIKLFEISFHLRHIRWQLSLHDKSSPSFAPIRGELVVDKLGSSVRTSLTFRG